VHSSSYITHPWGYSNLHFIPQLWH